MTRRLSADVEGGVTHLATLQGEIGKRLRARQAAVLVPVGRAGVGRKARAVAVKQLVDWRVAELAGDVPEADIDRNDAETIVLSQGALQVVIKELEFDRVLRDELASDHPDLRLRHGGAANPFAGNTRVRFDGAKVPFVGGPLGPVG